MGKWRTPAEEPNKQRINEQIRITPVRVISDDGEQLGVLPTAEAMEIATNAGLDLVEVAPKEAPPVCRIMDFGKYKYQQKKRQHKGHTHQVKVKEIRVRPKTGVHDLDVKVARARVFLANKDKVVVTVIFRGREMAHIEEGRRVVNEIVSQLEDIAKVESPPMQHGRRMTCTLSPR